MNTPDVLRALLAKTSGVFIRWVMTLDTRGKISAAPGAARILCALGALPALKWRCSQAEAQARFLLMGVAQRLARQEAAMPGEAHVGVRTER